MFQIAPKYPSNVSKRLQKSLIASDCFELLSTGRNRTIKPNSSESTGVISSGFRDPRIRIRGDRVTAPQNTHSPQYGFGRGYAGRLDGKRIFRTKNSDGKEVSRRFWTISYLLHGTAFGKIDFGKYRTTSPQSRKGCTVILSPSYKSNTLIKRSKVNRAPWNPVNQQDTARQLQKHNRCSSTDKSWRRSKLPP